MNPNHSITDYFRLAKIKKLIPRKNYIDCKNTKRIIPGKDSFDSCWDNETPKRETADGEITGPKSLKRTIDPPQAGDTPHPPSKRRPNSSQLSTTMCSETVKKENIDRMIENLNATKTGIFFNNNLEVRKKDFGNEIAGCSGAYNSNVNKIPPYNVKDVIIPDDRFAGHLFEIVTEVFSILKNCAYFNDEELSQVFTLVTLSAEAQEFLVQIYRKGNKWSNSCSDSELKKESLEKTGLFDFAINAESLENLIDQLSEKKLKDICRQFKSPCTVTQCRKLKGKNETRQYTKTGKAESVRDIMMKELLKTVSSQPGISARSSPREKLKIDVVNALGQRIRLQENVISLLDRILTLFTPFEEISVPVEDIFDKLTKTSKGTRCYPMTRIESYRLFQDRKHLVRYVDRRNKLKRVNMLVKAEDLEELKNIGNQAYSQLESLSEETFVRQEAVIPQCGLMYSDRYMCLELVTAVIEMFKKHPSLVPYAVQMLENLAKQENYPPSKRGDWYSQLASIQSKFTKEVDDLEFVAAATIKGLNLANLTEGTYFALTKKAEILLNKSDRLNPETKSHLKDLIKEKPKSFETVNVGAHRKEGNSKGQKSRWYIVSEDGTRIYKTVENIAAHHYAGQEYARSWHCEGSVSLTLFTLLMWEEIYSVSVPMAYLSPYQKAPLDLYTSEFYNNRKVQIDEKIKKIEALSAEELGTLVVESFEERKKYESVMPNDLKMSNQRLKEVVRCLGAKVVAGICQRMAENFTFWKAGFPDLVVWNPKKNNCKIVEVKGPRTFLTDKQTLWLEFLKKLGADAELCQVEDLNRTLSNCNENNTEA